MRFQLSTSEKSMISSHEDLDSRQNIANKELSPHSFSVISPPVPVDRNASLRGNATLGSWPSGGQQGQPLP